MPSATSTLGYFYTELSSWRKIRTRRIQPFPLFEVINKFRVCSLYQFDLGVKNILTSKSNTQSFIDYISTPERQSYSDEFYLWLQAPALELYNFQYKVLRCYTKYAVPKFRRTIQWRNIAFILWLSLWSFEAVFGSDLHTRSKKENFNGYSKGTFSSKNLLRTFCFKLCSTKRVENLYRNEYYQNHA